MFEFKGLVASSARKYNENAEFVTPVGKNIVSRKNIFSEKSKVVLGDVKNTALNIQTPKAEKTKKNINNLLVSTPTFKNVKTNELFGFSSPKLSTNIDIQPSHSTSISYSENHWNECDAWNEKLALSEENFKLLFLEPNENLAPPIPPSIEEEPPNDDIIFPSVSVTSDYGSIGQPNNDDIPPITMDFLDVDFWDDFKKDDQQVLTSLKF